MPDIKISELTAKGTAIASTDLVEISESNGTGGYVTKSVTGANIIASKQNTLVSGTNIKTIENQSLLGSGNIDLSKSDVGLGSVDNTSDVSKPISTATQNALNNKQNTITNSDSITEGATNLFLTSVERNKLVNTSGTNTGDQTNISGTAANVTGIVAVANGGTGTATPSLVAGTNITLLGTFPNQTINASGGGGGTQIGALIGGGVVVAVFVDGVVNKALVASLTNLSPSLVWTPNALINTLIGANAQSFFNGLTNTNAIIAQTGAPATTAYAAGIARLFAGGGFSDWYLPAAWELDMCYSSAAITSRIATVTPFFNTNFYWSSTENAAGNAHGQGFNNGVRGLFVKNQNIDVRAVRIHTI